MRCSFGRTTYEQALTFGPWPYADMPCWVFSHRPLVLEAGVTVTARSPTDVAAEIDARGLRRAWLVGGGALAASFRAEALITEYIVSVMPVILGGGVPLVRTGRAVRSGCDSSRARRSRAASSRSGTCRGDDGLSALTLARL